MFLGFFCAQDRGLLGICVGEGFSKRLWTWLYFCTRVNSGKFNGSWVPDACGKDADWNVSMELRSQNFEWWVMNNEYRITNDERWMMKLKNIEWELRSSSREVCGLEVEKWTPSFQRKGATGAKLAQREYKHRILCEPLRSLRLCVEKSRTHNPCLKTMRLEIRNRILWKPRLLSSPS